MARQRRRRLRVNAERTLTAVVLDGVGEAVLAQVIPAAASLGVRIMAEPAAEPGAGVDLLFVKRSELGSRQLALWPNLRGVQKIGVVTDNLDLDYLRDALIPVRTLAPPSAISVAEHTIALLLATARNLRAGMEAMQRTSGVAPRTTSESVMAFNWADIGSYPLQGRVLGLVGFGEIACQVAKRARSFGLRVVYTKRRPLPPQLERRFHVRYLPLPELLRSADLVSLHVPHTRETERMINAETLAVMKRSAILINTARGGLVDERALADALRDGQLAGVGLDVYATEPLPLESPLLHLPNAVLTPHTGGAGPVAMARCLTASLERWVADITERRNATA